MFLAPSGKPLNQSTAETVLDVVLAGQDRSLGYSALARVRDTLLLNMAIDQLVQSLTRSPPPGFGGGP